MPLLTDQEIAEKMKRREATLHTLGIFLGIFSAVVMIIFLGRLVKKKIDDARQRREVLRAETERYEKIRARESGNAPFEAPVSPRPVAPVPAFVDMSRQGEMQEKAMSPAEPLPLVAQTEAARITTKVEPSQEGESIETKIPAISSLLKEYFQAESVSAMLPLVRDARRVRPLMEDYYKRHPLVQRPWRRVDRADPVGEPGYRFVFVQAILEDSSPVRIIVEETPSGFLLDWESFVQYSELGWKEFLASKPGDPKVFRVIAVKPEAGEAAADGTVLKLKHPSESGFVIGRFDRSDPRFSGLVQQLNDGWKEAPEVPVTLRLCFPGLVSRDNEVQIAGVEGKGWLILDGRGRGS